MIKINLEKAQNLTREKLRRWRDAQFKENDIALQNALADGDDAAREAAITKRNWLRDLPEIADDKSLSELQEILETYANP